MASPSATKTTSAGRARVTRVLSPTDFSPASAAALDYAVLLTRLSDAELHLVHVVAYPEGLPTSESVLKKACSTALSRLQELGEGIEGVKSVTFAVRVGSPHGELVEYVRSGKVDMVVMGTVGLSGDHAVGSTAEKVIRALDVPVLTVKSLRPLKAAARVCSLCAKPSPDVICDACKESIRGEAVYRKIGKS